jgi:DNA-binding transcriptional MerR regulator
MLAGEAAKVLGVGIQTLHFYEQQGLIPPPPRSEGGLPNLHAGDR